MSVKRIIVLLTLLLAGCSQSFYSSGRKHLQQGQYEQAVQSFYEEIAVHPDNAAAWRELGVTYYRMGEMAKADDALKQANTIAPDARTHLFFGLIYEQQGEYEKAIDAYAASLNLNPTGKTREKVSAHLDQLIYQKMSHDISLAVEDEANIQTDTIPDNTVAVVNFDGSHLGSDLAPLAIGMAEFTSVDLAKVRSLNLVERLKIDAIINELKLGQSGYVDPASAPRMGRLLGSSKIITGSLLGIGDDGFRLDGVIVGATDSTATFTESNEGRLREIFAVQKQFVFSILDSLGIELTIEERDAIAEVPTESYLAFLAYSRGRYFQQQGMHEQARQEFNTAVSYDAGFSAAGTQAAKAAAAVSSGGYSQSQQALESYALSSDLDVDALVAGLDSRLVTILLNSGLLPDATLTNLATSQPQVGGTGRVVIEVDLEQ
ncbi:MAG: tetratricopeptide repeat protein [Candidatus Zixiibacteriota bacterium]|nr:MAG: tetratricopeptide repeat protein [candidate division Zixibacteria bacterium]